MASGRQIAAQLLKRPGARLALRIVGVLAAGLGCIITFRHVNSAALRTALVGAAGWPVALAMVVNLGPRTAARTRRTLAILRMAPTGNIGFRDLFQLLLGGYAAGYLVPGPAEEALHTAGLTRFGFRVRDLLSTHVLDKALGVLSIALVALPILPTGTMKLGLGGAAVLALAVIAGIGARSRSAVPLRAVIKALTWLLISNLLSVVMLRLCLSAVGAHVGFSECLQIFAVTACVCALPLTPGHIGVLETAFVVAATHLGVAASTALAAGVLYHCAHVVPLVLAGFPAMVRLLWIAKSDVTQPIGSPAACATQS